MATMCVRLTIVYLSVNVCLRIMGKRQIGELEVSELVTAIFISELASAPVCDANIPLLYGIIPVILLLFFEVALSLLSIKVNFFKNLLGKNPTFLIEKGKVSTKGLKKVRLTLNELMTELRLKDVGDPEQVSYAVMEPNGKISVILKAECQPVTPRDLKLDSLEAGIQHLVISDGAINHSALRAAGHDDGWLFEKLNEGGLTPRDVFMMCVDDAGKIIIVQKEKK